MVGLAKPSAPKAMTLRAPIRSGLRPLHRRELRHERRELFGVPLEQPRCLPCSGTALERPDDEVLRAPRACARYLCGTFGELLQPVIDSPAADALGFCCEAEGCGKLDIVADRVRDRRVDLNLTRPAGLELVFRLLTRRCDDGLPFPREYAGPTKCGCFSRINAMSRRSRRRNASSAAPHRCPP
jgi:hypothetical protein